MPVTPQPSAGFAAKSVGQPSLAPGSSRRRKDKSDNSVYAAARIREVNSHAEFFELRVKKMRGELLDRKLIEREVGSIFASIKGIVLASNLPMRDKIDLLSKLAGIPVLLEKG